MYCGNDGILAEILFFVNVKVIKITNFIFLKVKVIKMFKKSLKILEFIYNNII